jgi:hypothetical protein
MLRIIEWFYSFPTVKIGISKSGYGVQPLYGREDPNHNNYLLGRAYIFT